ncbi:MAG: helix-turn-helix transcriptional regulator [Sediminibacterium sp.]|jgi:transcriptional regulator with XRE-family HTH domain|nr:helix-turn-helix transcriptional regulator [Chitinophagaceae bacterium]MCA6447679.1 helix-turn-helix transcriptional regulator [Chitinophagaceae bacterium]NCO12692.1 helix-turn-helix transcriptional regulator [Candidatus Pacearchaeota archaeon]
MKIKQKTAIELFVIQQVRQKRIFLNYSQEDVASFIDKTRGFIGQVESPNHPAKYNLNHLNKIAKEFNCSIQEFFPDKPVF